MVPQVPDPIVQVAIITIASTALTKLVDRFIKSREARMKKEAVTEESFVENLMRRVTDLEKLNTELLREQGNLKETVAEMRTELARFRECSAAACPMKGAPTPIVPKSPHVLTIRSER